MKMNYIIITPAHNEQDCIEKVIQSVVVQTVLPQKWLIVNDASTDKTGAIIERYKKEYPFIEQFHLPRGELSSYYARRTHVFLAGFDQAKHLEYDYLAALDADLILPADYYEGMLHKFHENEKLGIATGVYVNKIGDRLEPVVRADQSTPGGLQMFRRECYDAIGGYRPLPYGGDDSLAEAMARMYNWKTQSFPQYKAVHLRPVGCAKGTGVLRAKFKQGLTDHGLGTHPLFMFSKSLRRMCIEKPYFLSGVLRFCGFMYGYTLKIENSIPPEAVKYLRQEQLRRMFRLKS